MSLHVSRSYVWIRLATLSPADSLCENACALDKRCLILPQALVARHFEECLSCKIVGVFPRRFNSAMHALCVSWCGVEGAMYLTNTRPNECMYAYIQTYMHTYMHALISAYNAGTHQCCARSVGNFIQPQFCFRLGL